MNIKSKILVILFEYVQCTLIKYIYIIIFNQWYVENCKLIMNI